MDKLNAVLDEFKCPACEARKPLYSICYQLEITTTKKILQAVIDDLETKNEQLGVDAENIAYNIEENGGNGDAVRAEYTTRIMENERTIKELQSALGNI